MRPSSHARAPVPSPRTATALVTATLLGALLSARAARADVVPVTTGAELEAAIDAAQPGDELVLADGTYAIGSPSCAAAGTAAAPIVVRAESPLGARIEVSGLEGFRVSGAFWRFEGLDIQGVCASHPDCEHAFHVTGKATDFTLRHSRVRDFNAQLKVNATPGDGGVYDVPHRGLIEYCDIGDTAPRATDSPVTKLNIDTGDGWVVRGNFLHDWHKDGGDAVSYGAFMKSGGNDGLFERNLVACSFDVATGGTRIGLSFGGGGTGAQYCAPAFDPNVPCDVEHSGGVLRNNLIIDCSDVGIYLNRAADTRVLFNTLVGTAGVDFRFETTTGEADGNVLEGGIRERDGGTFTPGNNLVEQDAAFFDALYADPLGGDFLLEGPADALIGQGTAVRGSAPAVRWPWARSSTASATVWPTRRRRAADRAAPAGDRGAAVRAVALLAAPRAPAARAWARAPAQAPSRAARATMAADVGSPAAAAARALPRPSCWRLAVSCWRSGGAAGARDSTGVGAGSSKARCSPARPDLASRPWPRRRPAPPRRA